MLKDWYPGLSSAKAEARFLPFILLGMILLVSCQHTVEREPAPNRLSHEQLTQIDSIGQAFIDKGNTVGLSIALAHEGEVLFSKGYGLAKRASNQPATDSTIYPIASISKLITGVLTMKMVEAGKLSLADKVLDHLPDLPQQAFMDEITLEHLLRHQSGLVDHEDWADSIYISERRVFTMQEFYAFLDQPLFFRPGSHYTYSNSGYAILSIILEQVTQQSFHQLIREYIAKPAGLSSLGMWPEQWHDPKATLGYELKDNGVDTSFHMMTEMMKGDGGLSASVPDLVRLGETLVQGSLISPSSFDYILSPTSIGDIAIDYGLGVKTGLYHHQATWGHSGGYKGTGWAMLAHYPESGYTFAAAINTNYSPEEVWTLRHLIMPIVLQISPPERDTTAVPQIEKYVGVYSSINRWGNEKPSIRIVSAKAGKLYWDNPDTETPPARLFPLNDSLFTWLPYPYDHFKFHQVAGKVVACSEYYDGLFGMVRLKDTPAATRP